MSTLRPLGIGSQILTHGDKVAGFYGEVNGIISANELRTMVGVTQGTAMQTGDITWLKFSHNYKTLFIAKKPIQHNISWDHLQSLDLVFGKMVEIGGSVYLLRLMQGDSINPFVSPNTKGNSEWGSLIVEIVENWMIYSYSQLETTPAGMNWFQEINSQIGMRLTRGGSSLGYYNAVLSNNVQYNSSWRPVLELLY